MNYLTAHWSFDPLLVVAAVAVALHELGLSSLKCRSVPTRTRERRRRSALFYAGLGVLALAVVSPIDYWADDYFFVHMFEHVLIMFIAPMLIVAAAPWVPLLHGVPLRARRLVLRAALLGGWARPLRAFGHLVTRPWVSVSLFNLAMVVWHVPALFDLAERDQGVHIWLMHGSLFATGLLFWLQVVPSRPAKRQLSDTGQASAMLVTNVVMICGGLFFGLLAMRSLYPVYDHLPGVTLPPVDSQRIGGAVLFACGLMGLPRVVAILRRRPAAADDPIAGSSGADAPARATGLAGRVSVDGSFGHGLGAGLEIEPRDAVAGEGIHAKGTKKI
jgi:cytochrome c oxidase assembly factor CtaG